MTVQKKEFKKRKLLLFGILIILLCVIIIILYKNTKIIRIQKELESKYLNVDNFEIEVINKYCVTSDGNLLEEKNIKKYISYGNEMNIFSKTDNQSELRSYVDKKEKIDAVWFYDTEEETNITNYLMYRPVNKIITIGNIISDEIEEMKFKKYTYTEEIVDNKKCIVFRTKNNQNIKEIYIEEESLLPVKTVHYSKTIDSNEYTFQDEKIFNIQIEGVKKSDILIPNKESFLKVEFSDINYLDTDENIDDKEEKKSIQNIGDGLIEKFMIPNIEKLNTEYFSVSDNKEIKYIEIENYSTYERFKNKWSNLRKLEKGDFKEYKIYIVVNTNITKDIEFKEKVISYDSNTENYILTVSEKNDTSYNTGILIIEPIKNYGTENFVELKNDLLIQSDEETMKMIEEKKELILQYVKNYTQNNDIQIASTNKGGTIKNIIPTNFFITEGNSNDNLEENERTCWVEYMTFESTDKKTNIILEIYIDTETKQLIAAKINMI